jgi:hypothetical protein
LLSKPLPLQTTVAFVLAQMWMEFQWGLSDYNAGLWS